MFARAKIHNWLCLNAIILDIIPFTSSFLGKVSYACVCCIKHVLNAHLDNIDIYIDWSSAFIYSSPIKMHLALCLHTVCGVLGFVHPTH